jgi:hypothetical protein
MDSKKDGSGSILFRFARYLRTFFGLASVVEHVKQRKVYHVTTTMPYKQAFAPGQTVRLGAASNPFFHFYETPREYEVNDRGQIVQVKAVAWLRQVRDGTINTSPQMLANVATEVAMHYLMLARELIMEEIRAKQCPDAPSRQQCLYVCNSLEEARYWNQRLGGNGTICELTCTGAIHRADARLLVGDSEPLSTTRDRARQYWRGVVGPNPEMETLFAGNATVTGFGL